MRAAAEALGAQRTAWVSKGQLDFADIANRMHGLLIFKFEWLWELPNTI